MKVNKIPDNFLTSENILYDKISPSLFTSIQKGCAYQNILYRIDNKRISNSDESSSLLLPISNNAIIGTIVHKMVELRSNGEINSKEDFNAKWDQEVFKTENKLIKGNIYLKHGFLINHLKKLQAMKSILSMPNFFPIEDKIKFSNQMIFGRTSEVGIWDIDFLHGTIDKVVFNENGIEIIDYKTGRICESDESLVVKEDYVVQLKLYAILFEKKFNKTVNSLAIIDIVGNKTQIKFNHAELKQLYDSVKDLIEELNNRIIDQNWMSLKQIDKDRCPKCICRSICRFYWESDVVSEHDIEGNLKNIYSNGVIEIQTDNNVTIRVKDTCNYNKDDLDQLKNHRIRVINIYFIREIFSIRIFTAKEWTRIYDVG